jgi:transposase-like protein
MGRRKRYSAEFKKQAPQRADEPGVTDLLVEEELGISARQSEKSTLSMQNLPTKSLTHFGPYAGNHM